VIQGKYASEILKRFHVENYKPMDIALATNWKKEGASSGEGVHVTIYR